MFWTLTRIINSFGPLFPCIRGFAGSPNGEESTYLVGDVGLDPWVGKVPWGKAWQATPVFLPAEFHGQPSLVATVHRVAESDTTEATDTFTPSHEVSFSKILQFYNACLHLHFSYRFFQTSGWMKSSQMWHNTTQFYRANTLTSVMLWVHYLDFLIHASA